MKMHKIEKPLITVLVLVENKESVKHRRFDRFKTLFAPACT